MPRFVAYDNSLDAWNPELWAQESLAILEENMVIGNLIHRDFSDEIQAYGDTVNTRRPSEYTAKRKGANDDVTVQDSEATNVAVKLDQHIHTSFTIKDQEQSYAFQDLVNVYLRPAAMSIARKVDRILMGQVYQYLGNAVGQLQGVTVANVKRTLLELGEKMDVNKAYVDGRNLVVCPATKTDILELDLFNAANQRGDEGTALRRASLGEILGFDCMMAQNTPFLTTAASTLNADELSADAAAGATVISLDSGGVVVVGQYLTLEGDVAPYRVMGIATNDITLNRALRFDVAAGASNLYAVTTGLVDLAGHVGVTSYPLGYDKEIKVDGTGVPHVGQLVSFNTDGSPNVALAGEYSIVDVRVSSGYYIELDRPLETAITDNDVVGYGPAGAYNFAFHRDALAMVMRPLAPPRAGAGAISAVANYNGLALRITVSYEGRGQGHLVTCDVLFGTKVLDTNLGAVLLA
jgi:hypothetical protein